MRGISGFTGGGERALLERMTRSLVHRGPDAEGYYQDNSVSLGMRRLAIVDTATGGQPIANETGDILVVFNGEIYNHQELRAELIRRGHRFRTSHCDTEVIVHLYEEFGDDWPVRAAVNGMFALALWDRPRGRLLLYRDRLGKKPLYWAENGGRLVFGSEIKAVLGHPEISDALDHRALQDYFTLKHIPAPFTAYRAVRQLPAGSFLVWRGGETAICQYWRPDFTPDADAPANLDEAAEFCQA